MEPNHTTPYPFLPSGCLGEEAARAYATGTLPEAQQERVKHHLDTCAFCTMAVEGISTFVQHQHETAFNDLLSSVQAQADQRLQSIKIPKAPRKTRFLLTVMSVAATLLMLGGLYLIIKLYLPQQNDYLADNTSLEFHETLTATDSQPLAPLSQPPASVLEEPSSTQGQVAENKTPSQRDQKTSKSLEQQTPAVTTLSYKAPVVIVDADDIALDEDVSNQQVTTEEKAVSLSGATIQKDALSMPTVSYSSPAIQQSPVSEITITSQRTKKSPKAGNRESKKEDEAVFTVVEEMPSYPGGEEARVKFLMENLAYPAAARESGISGTVYISFVVTSQGNITQAKVLRGIGGGCDEEALRVIKKMPRWTPGKQSGKPVDVQFTMPVKFSLTANDSIP